MEDFDSAVSSQYDEFFDRTIPAVVIESIRLEYSLNDKQLGMLAAAFSLVYAIAGLYFGKLADRNSRKKLSV